jgi:hypothetical protein
MIAVLLTAIIVLRLPTLYFATTGTGHRWRLIDDQPWRRLYVELRLTT